QRQVRDLRRSFIKCLATFGSGLAVPIRLIPVTAPDQARSANTTASSCAINTFSAAAPARRRALIFAKRIATSFNPINGGNSQGSVWRAISRERKKQFCCWRRRDSKFSRRSPDQALKKLQTTDVQIFLRQTGRAG